LAGVADASIEAADGESQMPAQETGFAIDLHRQLPGRHDDQGFFLPAGSGPEHVLENRDQERGGLAGPRLGLDGRIRALERVRQGLLLDGRQLGVASFRDGTEEAGMQIQFVKKHRYSFD